MKILVLSDTHSRWLDAVDIITMKSCTSLERKTTEQLKAIQKNMR